MGITYRQQVSRWSQRLQTQTDGYHKLGEIRTLMQKATTASEGYDKEENPGVKGERELELDSPRIL